MISHHMEYEKLLLETAARGWMLVNCAFSPL
jgi:hypothetical protein